jgi:uncharacterized repeat protein (TIGR01451 family)/LPXTG-motif cell wall-anchored protein
MKEVHSRIFGGLPRRIFAGAVLALAIALPMAASAAQTVKIEASTGVANVTAGDTAYKSAVNASYDQVVKVQVAYNNTEEAGSGKVASNLRVKINMPNTAAATQSINTITSADNSNVVNGVATVNTGRTDAYLQYEPGTAVWAHADAQGKVTTENLGSKGDGIASGSGIVLENGAPAQAGSVTVLARVTVPGVKIIKQSELKNAANKWSSNNAAKPGDTMKYLIEYQNTGNTPQKNVVIRDVLPHHMALVPGTTKLTNSTYPSGKTVTSNDVVGGGIVIGNYGTGANAYVTFEAKIDDASKLACGNNTFRNVGVAHPKSMNEYQSAAVTIVNRDCGTQPGAPVYTCNTLNVTKLGGHQVEIKVNYTAKAGATLKDVAYDFGDGSTPLTTNKVTTRYTYAKDGAYTVSAKLLFSVDGKDKIVSSDNCVAMANLVPTSVPPAGGGSSSNLPNTGAGNIAVLFAGASVLGGAAYRMFLSRRLARQ